MANSRSVFLKKLNDQQFEIHTQMCTCDSLTLTFPATSDSWPPVIVDR